MNAHEQLDQIRRLLGDLPPVEPSASIDRRVVSRCHALLARQHRRQAAVARSRAVRARAVDVAMAAAIGMYGLVAAIEAARLAFLR